MCIIKVFSLEPQGNDFTSSGQLGFLQIETIRGYGALNTERRENDREKKTENERIRRESEKNKSEKIRQAEILVWIRATATKSQPGKTIIKGTKFHHTTH